MTNAVIIYKMPITINIHPRKSYKKGVGSWKVDDNTIAIVRGMPTSRPKLINTLILCFIILHNSFAPYRIIPPCHSSNSMAAAII